MADSARPAAELRVHQRCEHADRRQHQRNTAPGGGLRLRGRDGHRVRMRTLPAFPTTAAGRQAPRKGKRLPARRSSASSRRRTRRWSSVSRILSIRNSAAASSSIGCRSLRRIQIFCSSSVAVISSSRRVPGAVDVERRVDALLGDAPVEVDFAVAGALELLVDHVVHARAGVDQRGGEDRERAAFLDVARRAEEALRPLQRVRRRRRRSAPCRSSAPRCCRRARAA